MLSSNRLVYNHSKAFMLPHELCIIQNQVVNSLEVHFSQVESNAHMSWRFLISKFSSNEKCVCQLFAVQGGVVYSNEHECMLQHVGVYQRSTWWYEQGTHEIYYWVKSVAIVSWTKKFNLWNSFFNFLIPFIQIIICFMHSFLFNNEYYSMTFFFVHVFYPKKILWPLQCIIDWTFSSVNMLWSGGNSLLSR